LELPEEIEPAQEETTAELRERELGLPEEIEPEGANQK
jgi:hypothetical protein